MPFNSLLEFSFCNSLLNMCHGIMLPLLPISILYGTIILLSTACISNSAINSDQFLFTCIESILTVSILPLLYCWDVSHYFIYCPTSSAVAYFLEMSQLATPHTCLPICWTLSWWVYSATILMWLPLQHLANWSLSSIFLCPF